MITSYSLLSNMAEAFSGAGLWDYVILDEGHVIKNPATKMSKAAHSLNCSHKLLLTGIVHNPIYCIACIIVILD